MPRYESTTGTWAAANTIPQGPEAIRTLTDVLAPNPQDGDGLVWVDRDKKWEPVALGPAATVVLSTDSFNRANSATNLGSTDGAGSLDPLVWVQARGTWGITSNQAYPPAAPVGPPRLRAGAYVPLGLADVDLTLTVTHRDATTGILFRYVDNDNYWAFFNDDANNCQLAKVVAGTSTLMGSNHVGGADPVVLRVVTAGSSISIYRDGVFLETLVNTTFQTATNHGMISDSVNGRYDTWSASGAGTAAAPFVPIAGGTMTGPLILSGNPVVDLGAVPKQYVDTRPPFPPWTVGTNGDVTATVDDITKTALTIEKMVGQTAPTFVLGGVPIQTGNGTPFNVVTPAGLVALYIDEDAGAIYSAIGVTSADWVCIGGNGDRSVQGFFPGISGGSSNMIVPVAGGFEIIDPEAYLGTGNGIQWITVGTDGFQEAQIAVGPVGGIYWRFGYRGGAAADGSMSMRNGNIDAANDLFQIRPDGLVVSNAQVLPDVADMQVGDHGSISDPTAASPSITRFLKDSASVLRTEKISLGVPDYTQSFLLAGV